MSAERNADITTMIPTGQRMLKSVLPAEVQRLVSASLSEGTKRGYQNDIAHFEKWGGSVPASPETVAAYLADLSATYKTATIVRRVTALSKAHDAIGAPNSTKSEIVRATMRGIKRTLGTATKEAKPTLREDLFQMLERMGDGPKDIRDKALLLLGFAGAFRRSELIGLDIADIEHVRQGIVVTLRRSKTDQIGAGRKIGIPFGRSRWCPVKHLTEWLEHAKIEAGPIFRAINRHGHIANQRLSGEAVCIIVKQRAEAAGFGPSGYSGHSLRAGLATSAAMAGASAWKIRAQTGHASDAMLTRYIRDGDMFTSNAAGAVL
ncbi:site-specific integrase [Mesorhizobium sp. VK24D]|uniref:Site-specific integrase n=1 Tax=Mesorhizobium album TaxID=3072314 RepID=A0ABU4XTR2_9HYPH|nr:site-specific integrase [Mesorhizobium sp. VK24D]MDX8477007.1 site-specific integrase [Mesorhizobium sp. VK24D]